MKRLAGVGALTFVAGFILWSWAGDLEPPGPPGATMVTLAEIDAKLNGAVDVCFDNVGRFVVCGDGAVKDNLTGLFWLENANCFGALNWADASIAAAQLSDGQCGLTDGSAPGDWRLPTADEWFPITTGTEFDNGCPPPYFPDVIGTGCCGTGTCPASGVQLGLYWSSTTAFNPSTASCGDLYGGDSLLNIFKTNIHSVWPVRGGQ
jgi:hypothetical protein